MTPLWVHDLHWAVPDEYWGSRSSRHITKGPGCRSLALAADAAGLHRCLALVSGKRPQQL